VAAMSDQNKNLPPQAQVLLDANLKSVGQPAPPRDLQAHFAERLNYCRQFDQNYCRQFDQTKMPAWKDPRK
jgi:hypothetical protein